MKKNFTMILIISFLFSIIASLYLVNVNEVVGDRPSILNDSKNNVNNHNVRDYQAKHRVFHNKDHIQCTVSKDCNDQPKKLTKKGGLISIAEILDVIDKKTLDQLNYNVSYKKKQTTKSRKKNRVIVLMIYKC